MRPPRTVEQWRDQLDSYLPSWRWIVVNDSESFPVHWMAAKGASRAAAYRALDHAFEVLDGEAQEVLDLYMAGVIGRTLAKIQLRHHVSERVQREHPQWDLPEPDVRAGERHLEEAAGE